MHFLPENTFVVASNEALGKSVVGQGNDQPTSLVTDGIIPEAQNYCEYICDAEVATCGIWYSSLLLFSLYKTEFWLTYP